MLNSKENGLQDKKYLKFNIQKNKQIVVYDYGRFKFTFDNLTK
jgi:hypothetical protein